VDDPGQRHRVGGSVERVAAPWGEPLDPADVERACETHDPDVVGLVHAETSTGALQSDVPGITDAAHDHDALVILDTVTSLGGVELRIDD
jgi:alanine-glyoxylate transaminase/serine-glyoxylate transaminase/serine-pyruvate transaminase